MFKKSHFFSEQNLPSCDILSIMKFQVFLAVVKKMEKRALLDKKGALHLHLKHHNSVSFVCKIIF